MSNFVSAKNLVRRLNKTPEGQRVGGLSVASKTGIGTAYPNKYCRQKCGVCDKCYMDRGHFGCPNVVEAMDKRWQLLDSPTWVSDMVTLIKAAGVATFRWQIGGDVKNKAHARNILDVCEATPEVGYWLPTKKLGLFKALVAEGRTIPANLCIRESAKEINDDSAFVAGSWSHVSTVHDDPAVLADWVSRGAVLCMATVNHSSCEEEGCDACLHAPWVTYPLH